MAAEKMGTTGASATKTAISDREIVSERVLEAPRELVFAAFSNPEHLAKWWGPNGFHNTIHEFDLRPGGKWRFVMHGPDGIDYHNESAFTEVVRPERIVFEHLKPMHWYQMIITFAEHAANTRLTWHMQFDSASECEKVKPFVIPANEQNFDRLEDELSKMAQHNSARGEE